MPRLYASNNDPIDFCNTHFPTEAKAEAKYGQLGDGPDGRGNCFGYDCEHPAYDGEGYKCHTCKRTLTDRNA